MAVITINGTSLDVAGENPALTTQVSNNAADEAALPGQVQHGQAGDASKSDYVLVQTKGPVTSEQKTELTKLGLVPHRYVSEDTYLYGYKNTDLKIIRDFPFVAYADVYPEQFVIAPTLHQGAASTDGDPRAQLSASQPQAGAPIEVDIIFHRDVDSNTGHVKVLVAEKAGVDVNGLEFSPGKARVSIESPDRLRDIAAIDAVQFIQRVVPITLHNNVARGILGLDHLSGTSLCKGSGQTVCVADTGFDMGSTTDTLPAFTGRVKKLYALGRPGRMDDPAGHGTHVAGSVLGSGVTKVFPPSTMNSLLADGTSASGSRGGVMQGTAPEASLVLQSLLTATGGLAVPSDLSNLFSPPYLNDGARIHTNSWGPKWQGEQQLYNIGSSQIDTFVWQHPEMVIIYSAGNDGTDQMLDASGNVIGGEVADGVVDLGTVGNYATAKNCIAVGASESLRPKMQPNWGRWWPKDFPANPLWQDQIANSRGGMAPFSSRGPSNHRSNILQQRFKPDVVAPGSFILSARSRAATDRGWGTVVSDNGWFWEGGTSMAAPLVAGCAAVVREGLAKLGTPTPSAALVKALLINGAGELRGQYTTSEAGASPNNNAGWGLVNFQQFDLMFKDPTHSGFIQGGPLSQGEHGVHSIRIPSGTNSFKVTLVWSDPPGETLQNDLDLIVTAMPPFRILHGNMGASEAFDRVNNVEQVIINDLRSISSALIPPRSVQIIVNAFRIVDGPDSTDGPQPYALAWCFS